MISGNAVGGKGYFNHTRNITDRKLTPPDQMKPASYRPMLELINLDNLKQNYDVHV